MWACMMIHCSLLFFWVVWSVVSFIKLSQLWWAVLLHSFCCSPYQVTVWPAIVIAWRWCTASSFYQGCDDTIGATCSAHAGIHLRYSGCYCCSHISIVQTLIHYYSIILTLVVCIACHSCLGDIVVLDGSGIPSWQVPDTGMTLMLEYGGYTGRATRWPFRYWCLILIPRVHPTPPTFSAIVHSVQCLLLCLRYLLPGACCIVIPSTLFYLYRHVWLLFLIPVPFLFWYGAFHGYAFCCRQAYRYGIHTNVWSGALCEAFLGGWVGVMVTLLWCSRRWLSDILLCLEHCSEWL